MNDLLLRIARCPNVAEARRSPLHPCHRIVTSQDVDDALFQVPEPWNGHLSSAPVLFLSSNPSIGDGAEYPRSSWSDQQIEDFFANRFGGGTKPWTVGGNKALLDDGTHAKANKFWSSIRMRAMELYEREVVPGRDYALTEVVRCKSREENGVAEAKFECAGRYLLPTLEASGAAVIVALGAVAEWWVRRLVSFEGPLSEVVRLGARERLFAVLPHPNAWRVPKKFSGCLSDTDLIQLREHLRGASESSAE